MVLNQQVSPILFLEFATEFRIFGVYMSIFIYSPVRAFI